jgi:hypothetical protein
MDGERVKMNDNEIKNYDDPIDMLMEKYPLVFKNACLDSYWELPAGWISIVDSLCHDINKVIEESYAKFPPTDENPGFSVMQIKSKFNSLRFYFMTISEDKDLMSKIESLVNEAERESSITCMTTGKPITNWFS